MQSERENGKFSTIRGEMAEWSIAAVLKTVEVRASGGSNPSLSADKGVNQQFMQFTPFITPENLRAIKPPPKIVIGVEVLFRRIRLLYATNLQETLVS